MDATRAPWGVERKSRGVGSPICRSLASYSVRVSLFLLESIGNALYIEDRCRCRVDGLSTLAVRCGSESTWSMGSAERKGLRDRKNRRRKNRANRANSRTPSEISPWKGRVGEPGTRAA